MAHVRGGGEYGEDWHLGGKKATKQNTITDFIACAEYLVEHKFTSPKYLAGVEMLLCGLDDAQDDAALARHAEPSGHKLGL